MSDSLSIDKSWGRGRIIVIAVLALGAILGIAAALGASIGDASAISGLRYTLEMEVAGQRYRATSVVQTAAYSKSKWAFEIGTEYIFRFRGEGLGIRFADGRALVVKFPTFRRPPGYDATKPDAIERFIAEAKPYPVNLNAKPPPGPTPAFVLDDATAPKAAWRFDWLQPEIILGPSARIIRFEMTPTRDPPTFDLGKVVPWIVVDRRDGSKRIFVAAQDSWHAYHAFRAKLKEPKVKDTATALTLNSEAAHKVWLNASDAFSSTADWKSSLVSDVEAIAIQYSSDLKTMTLVSSAEPTLASSAYIQRDRTPVRDKLVPINGWAPIVCTDRTGCVDLLFGPNHAKTRGAMIEPNTGLVFVVEHDNFTTASDEFQRDER